MRTIAISLLAASALFGQEARIIIIERGDTYELKQAYAEFKAARDHWEKVKTDVAKRYTTEKTDKAGCSKPVNGMCEKTMDGWDRVEFSVDFRALVPAHQYSSSITWAPAGTANWAIGSNSQSINASVNLGDLAVDGVRSDVTVKEPYETIKSTNENFVPAPLPPTPRSSVEDRSQMRGDITGARTGAVTSVSAVAPVYWIKEGDDTNQCPECFALPKDLKTGPLPMDHTKSVR